MAGTKPDEQLRTPMQWSSDEAAGFTTGSPWEPVNEGYQSGTNVADQSEDPDSLLSHYRRLVYARNQHAALRVGDLVLLDSGHPAVLAYVRVSENEAIIVIVNLSEEPVKDYELSLDSSPIVPGEYLAVSLFDDRRFAPIKVGDQGGFLAYRPIDELPRHRASVIQLTEK